MSLSLSVSFELDKATIGNDAGWLLGFHREENGRVVDDPVLEIGASDYHAEIKATLPGGLEGGSYTFVVEGLTDDHYGKIAQGKEKSPTVVKLYLFWRDTNASAGGYLANMAGLTDTFSQVKGKDIPQAMVAALRIVSVTRKAGARRYETTINAKERIFSLLESRRLCQAVAKDTTADALKELLEAQSQLQQGKDKDYVFHGLKPNSTCPPPAGANQGSERRELAAGKTILELLRDLGNSMEETTGRYGRGMFLIRDGRLHLGVRPIPLAGDGKDPKKLMLGNGLIETEALAPVQTDPNFDYCQNAGKKPPERRQFKLTLKGRPDLKPGDLVEFDLPPEEVDKTGGGLLGALGDLVSGALLPSLGEGDFKNPVKLYVASVEHVLGRTKGFATTVTGVEIKDVKETWDCHTPQSRGGSATPPTPANPETEAAHAVRRLTENAVEARNFPEVGEVRQMTSSGSAEPPGQTLTVWRGLAPGDGRSGQARRQAIQRPSPAPASGVPYTTPFAWGKCGLVLPRYPGTRVLVAHRGGRSDDPVDVGAVWESGHGPDSKAGDWWLILPAGIPAQQRATLADSATPQEHTGPATNDLIDADGNRVIEVGELTVRIGRGQLNPAGNRPARGEADAVTIEHAAKGSKIVIKKDGTIEIHAAADMLLKADGDIKMEAQNVKVKVSGSMDVS